MCEKHKILSTSMNAGPWLTHPLLPRSFCFMEHFTSNCLGSQLTQLLNTLNGMTHFTPLHILLLSIFCSQEYSSAHFASCNTQLLGTLCFLCSRKQSMLGRTFYKRAKCFIEHSIPRSRVFQEAKCADEQIFSRSKVFQGSKFSEEQ